MLRVLKCPSWVYDAIIFKNLRAKAICYIFLVFLFYIFIFRSFVRRIDFLDLFGFFSINKNDMHLFSLIYFG